MDHEILDSQELEFCDKQNLYAPETMDLEDKDVMTVISLPSKADRKRIREMPAICHTRSDGSDETVDSTPNDGVEVSLATMIAVNHVFTMESG